MTDDLSGPAGGTATQQSAASPTPSGADAATEAPTPVVLNPVIDPYTSCTEDDESVCTLNAIYGCTEPGRRFADYGDCATVETQRPSPDIATVGAQLTDPDPTRLDDPDFEWVKQEVEACGCVCCHSAELGGAASFSWDIDFGPVWTESLTDRGVGIFAGVVPSTSLGFADPADNNGFYRDTTGAPSTDPERMRAFFVRELERRGADLRDVRVTGSSQRIDAGIYGPDGGVGE